jgi:hypothetical protein
LIDAGKAGTGKSITLNKFTEYLKASKIPFAITAPTGIAASLVFSYLSD